MPDILQIGSSGLMAFQRGLATTGHNIANAGTEGYSRQDIKLDTRYASLVEGGYIGNGVSVYDIERSYSAFLAKDYQIATSGLGKFETATRMANRLDNLIADQERGLASQIERYFNSLQDVSNNPTSIPERQVMLGEAQALVQQFQYLDTALGALNEEVNDQLESYVQEINTIAEDIAKLNDQISVARSKSAEGQEPNDLLDQRDRALLALSKLVAVTTSEQDEGVVNVLIGNGQPLVIGNRSEALSLNVGEFDPLIKDIAFKRTNGSETTITNFLTGGAIQGLIDFREGMLNSTRQQVGLLVTGLVTSINDQHRLGVDLKGELGGDFFSGGAPEVFSSLENTGLAQVEAVITDVKSLEPT
ncbi:MAG: flagellar hook-associated protein FlgK, partial [Betaproteobacteria bacterium]